MPTVTTNEVTNITAASATCGGNVTDDGGFTVTARGVCWSTSPNPTISDSHTTDGTGTGEFTSSLTGLTDNATYYIRAYATNSKGTRYGEQKSFKATNHPGSVGGKFSINSSQQVYFSQGNLQYQASTRTWRFAEHQWDYIGNSNSNISSSYSGWIDLFGWGTSGYNGKNPWMTSTTSTDYGNGNRDIAGTNYDWGVNNTISNGGGKRWRTLTNDEWVYVFNTRTTTSGIRYAKATVNGKAGVILLPDDWSSSYYSLSSTNASGAAFTSNSISASDWTSSLEAHGAVFLPAAGCRGGTDVMHVGSIGLYWSASYYTSYDARYVYFNDGGLFPGNWNGRHGGLSVRLVCPAEN